MLFGLFNTLLITKFLFLFLLYAKIIIRYQSVWDDDFWKKCQKKIVFFCQFVLKNSSSVLF